MSLLPQPKSNRQEVLLTLIKNGKVSIEDYPYLSGFRTRVSELTLEHGLILKSKPVNAKNKFGRTITYVEHHLEENEIENAIAIYNSINNL
ncbi:hypothetical protein [Flavobacterium caseinilyticum]|nr:hypothetical protein [Flavobacterium caseinilyticum]